MYKNYFGFIDDPFKQVPEKEYFFSSTPHENTMNLLEYGINSRKGFILLLGAEGTGKTTLSMILKETLTSCKAAYTDTKNADISILKQVCDGFEIKYENGSDDELLGRIIEFLVDNYKDGSNALVIVDNTEFLQEHDFQLLKSLNEIEIEKCKLIQILLIGRQTVKGFYAPEGFDNAQDEVSFIVKLKPLTLQETTQYVAHRLDMVLDGNSDIFRKTAIVELFRYSEGIPGKINSIASAALEKTMGEKSKRVSSRHVIEAAKHTGADIKPVKSKTDKLPVYLTTLATLVVILFIGGTFYLNKKEKPPVVASNSNNYEKQQVVEKTVETVNDKKPDVAIVDNKTENITDNKSEDVKVVDNKSIEDKTDNKTDVESADNKTEEKIVEKPKIYGCVTASSGLKMRDKPSTKSNTVTVAKYNATVEIIKQDGNWVHVILDDKEGYMFYKYVKTLESGDSCK